MLMEHTVGQIKILIIGLAEKKMLQTSDSLYNFSSDFLAAMLLCQRKMRNILKPKIKCEPQGFISSKTGFQV